MKQFSAFSLVELLVVIAIIGVLATVAIPSYKQYQLRAKISATLPAAKAIIDKSMQYTVIHDGVFPNPWDIGLISNVVVGCSQCTYALHPPNNNILAYVQMGNYFGCAIPGRISVFTLYFNAYNLGLSQVSTDLYNIQYYVVRINDVNTTYCVNNDMPDNLVPFCTTAYATVLGLNSQACVN